MCVQSEWVQDAVQGLCSLSACSVQLFLCTWVVLEVLVCSWHCDVVMRDHHSVMRPAQLARTCAVVQQCMHMWWLCSWLLPSNAWQACGGSDSICEGFLCLVGERLECSTHIKLVLGVLLLNH